MPGLLRLLCALLVSLSVTAAAPAPAAAQRGRGPAKAAKKAKRAAGAAARKARRHRSRPAARRRAAGRKAARRRAAARLRRQSERGHRGRLLESAAAAASARLDLLSRAKREILVSSYIFTNDRVGRLMMAQLRRAARAGKRVKLLVDGAGSSALPKEALAHLAAEGVEVARFNPPRLAKALSPGELTYRMHDKLLVIDGESVVLGGRNVEEGYFGLNKPGYTKFTDVDVHVKGPAARRARRYFGRLWESPHVETVRADSVRIKQRKLARFRKKLDRAERMLGRERFARFRRRWRNKPSVLLDKVRFLNENPKALGNPDTRIHRRIVELIDGAQSEVEIQTPYLVPTRALIAAVERARERRVTVRFITNSKELSRGHDRLPYLAYESKLDALARAGAEVWEHRGERSLHNKTAVMDGQRLLIGSHNIDPRSQRLNKEVGLLANAPEVAKRLLARGRKLRRGALKAAGGGRVTREKRASQGWFSRFFARYFFGPLSRATGLYGQL